MMMTFDFITYANHNQELKQQIVECISSDRNDELCTHIHRIKFDGTKRIVMVEALSGTSPFSEKIIPLGIKYDVLLRVLDGDWDEFENGIVSGE